MAMNMRKGSKRNIPVSLACVLFCLTLISVYLTSGLYAKYTTSHNNDDTAQVAAFGKITLEEVLSTKAQDGGLAIIPGQNITKNATVDYTGGETAVYIFVEMTLSNHWSASADNLTFSTDMNMLSFSIEDGWTHLNSNGGTHIYYLALAVGETLEKKPIIKNDGAIYVSDEITASYLTSMTGISVSLRAIAAQDHGTYAVTSIWEAVK